MRAARLTILQLLIVASLFVGMPQSAPLANRVQEQEPSYEDIIPNFNEDARGNNCMKNCMEDGEDPDECRESCIQTVQNQIPNLRIACR